MLYDTIIKTGVYPCIKPKKIRLVLCRVEAKVST